jgi:hypothetical protein
LMKKMLKSLFLKKKKRLYNEKKSSF